MLQLFMFSRVTRVCTIIAHMRVNLAILCVFESIVSHMFTFVNSFSVKICLLVYLIEHMRKYN